MNYKHCLKILLSLAYSVMAVQISEKEIIMVKVLKDFYPWTYFLKLGRPPNTQALGIVQVVNNTFTDTGIPDKKRCLLDSGQMELV